MSRRRPGTAGSVRSSSAVGALRVRPGSRPSSAREWFEAYNHRRNEEAWRMEEWRNTVNLYKRREWEAQYYNIIAQPRKKISDEEEWKRKEEKRRKLEERRNKLRTLLKEDEKRYQDEREKKYRESKHHTVHRHFMYPEVDMMRTRLEDLKKKNQEERKKLSEALSYEAWRKSNPQVRQMESERFGRFVQDAWVNQRQWKADERERRIEEDRKKEKEAEEIRLRIEEEERKVQEERLSKQAEWKVQLEAQIEQIKERERKDELLAAEEIVLEKEKLQLHEISQRRDRMKELRQRKELELFWARQHQLKLKKRAADIQQELLEDEGIVEDLLGGFPPEDVDQQMKQRRAEAEWMKAVLGEQRRLEVLREKEYELLFSEEAERMWHKRQAEWEKEQKARDKLMTEVLQGLQKQVQAKSSKNSKERDLLNAEKSALQQSISETRDKMHLLETERKQMQERKSYVSKPSERVLQETAALRRDHAAEEQKLEEHRREIERLEREMQHLWGPHYAPPRYGRKKFAW
ncbi:trichoplein keratin filament-binding protein-like [Portunus trituberculatus]|uniref:trichoplein keratin filament-binding protein-like n=1 Tax=Portunus trituberculatus TaxID=210409 RepID=UPI001E1CB952|nr:trichoplein keratin filament-binding protein-like [Portunus trituberculatus]